MVAVSARNHLINLFYPFCQANSLHLHHENQQVWWELWLECPTFHVHNHYIHFDCI